MKPVSACVSRICQCAGMPVYMVCMSVVSPYRLTGRRSSLLLWPSVHEVMVPLLWELRNFFPLGCQARASTGVRCSAIVPG